MADDGYIHSFIKCKLLKQHRYSFHGVPLWQLSSKWHRIFFFFCRKALRVKWRAPHMTHKHVIALLADCMPLVMSLKKRYLKFYQRHLNGNSSVVRDITKMSLFNPYSPSASNYVDINK